MNNIFRSQPDGVILYNHKVVAGKAGEKVDINTPKPFKVHLVNEAVQKLSGINIEEIEKMDGEKSSEIYQGHRFALLGKESQATNLQL